MALGSQLPIRLDPDTDQRLQAAADQAGTSKSAIMRMLAKTFVDQCVSHSGQVTLPPDWATLLPARDGRSMSNQNSIVQIGGVGHKAKQTHFHGGSAEPVKRKKNSGGRKGKKK